MKISLYPPLSIHEIGQRDNQEDSLVQQDNLFFVLCDGMGGHEHGELASQTVCQAFGAWYKTHAVQPIDKFQIEKGLAYSYDLLDQKDGGELKKMGTTLTILYIGRKGALAAHMGDSRIYHIRPGVGILYQSRDHSLVFDLYQAGEITYEEMGSYAKKNIVTRAMTPGIDHRMRVDTVQMTDIRPGDYFYLCSDGMLEQMNNQQLVDILSSNQKDEEKRRQLVDATVHNQDNHSAWLIHVKDVIKETDDEWLVNEEPTSRCNVVNIIPQSETSGDDDVVMVSMPPKKQKQSLMSRVLQMFRSKNNKS